MLQQRFGQGTSCHQGKMNSTFMTLLFMLLIHHGLTIGIQEQRFDYQESMKTTNIMGAIKTTCAVRAGHTCWSHDPF
jgi:hypothetical protein